MKTTWSCGVVSAIGLVGLSLLAPGCNDSNSSPSSGAGAATPAATAPPAAGGSGDSVGAPECDDVLKKASAPGCKDKPGMSAIEANRQNWKNGLANATSKDATIQACKATMNAVKAVCGDIQAGGATGGGAGAGGPGDSVGDPECDDVLKKAAAPACKDKPGISAITANRQNWKNGLANAMTKNATIQACKATMNTLKAAGCH